MGSLNTIFNASYDYSHPIKSPQKLPGIRTLEGQAVLNLQHKYLANCRMQCITYGWYQTGSTIELSVAGYNVKYQGNSLFEEY